MSARAVHKREAIDKRKRSVDEIYSPFVISTINSNASKEPFDVGTTIVPSHKWSRVLLPMFSPVNKIDESNS
jgi:hypothetical protein